VVRDLGAPVGAGVYNVHTLLCVCTGLLRWLFEENPSHNVGSVGHRRAPLILLRTHCGLAGTRSCWWDPVRSSIGLGGSVVRLDADEIENQHTSHLVWRARPAYG
jgi:hypothetical protein